MIERTLQWIDFRAAENTAHSEDNKGVVEYLRYLVKEDARTRRVADEAHYVD